MVAKIHFDVSCITNSAREALGLGKMAKTVVTIDRDSSLSIIVAVVVIVAVS